MFFGFRIADPSPCRRSYLHTYIPVCYTCKHLSSYMYTCLYMQCIYTYMYTYVCVPTYTYYIYRCSLIGSKAANPGSGFLHQQVGAPGRTPPGRGGEGHCSCSRGLKNHQYYYGPIPPNLATCLNMAQNNVRNFVTPSFRELAWFAEPTKHRTRLGPHRWLSIDY